MFSIWYNKKYSLCINDITIYNDSYYANESRSLYWKQYVVHTYIIILQIVKIKYKNYIILTEILSDTLHCKDSSYKNHLYN